MAELNIIFEKLWVKEDATGEPCTLCDNPIYSQVNALYITIGNKTTELNTRICDSCFDILKDNNAV